MAKQIKVQNQTNLRSHLKENRKDKHNMRALKRLLAALHIIEPTFGLLFLRHAVDFVI